MNDAPQVVKHTIDAAAALSAIGSLIGTIWHVLPGVAAFFASVMAGIWYTAQWRWAKADREAKGL